MPTLTSIISLNVFVLVANPLIRVFLEAKVEDYQQYMECRKQENIEIIISKLKI